MLATLELNDQLLQIQPDNGPVFQESGFARLTADGIETGEEPRASAWREPQNSYNQYWCHLNQTALPGKQKWARHHADIAFAQLKHLWHSAGEPDSLLILVPGSITDPQLSLLLGMINALPSKVVAVIDSALSACLHLKQETLFVDLQLHQAVVSLCRFDGSTINIADQEVVPELGMMQILNRVSRHISNLLIRSFRYDPLHASESEQMIYDQLPNWLGRLVWEQEVSATLPSDQGELPFILSKNDVQKLMRDRLNNLRSIIDRHSGAKLAFSHASRILFGLSDEFSRAGVATQSTAIDNGLLHQQLIIDQVDSLQRVISLDLGELVTAQQPVAHSLATHLLCNDQALSIHGPVSIRIGDKGIELRPGIDDKAALSVVLRNRNIEVVHRATGMEVSIPRTCKPGEALIVGEHELKLIEVMDG